MRTDYRVRDNVAQMIAGMTSGGYSEGVDSDIRPAVEGIESDIKPASEQSEGIGSDISRVFSKKSYQS